MFTKNVIFFLVITTGILLSCNPKKAKSDIDITFTPDTLNVGYTYWWPESGPFIGSCGEELSLVLVGTLVALDAPNDDPGPLYTAQRGVVQIEKVFKIKALEEHTYASQQFLTTDCFYGSGLTEGDQVLVSCYDYEGDYSIPGGKSILKIKGLDVPLINSIKTYIDTDQDPKSIENDFELWAEQGMGKALLQLLDCGEVVGETE